MGLIEDEVASFLNSTCFSRFCVSLSYQRTEGIELKNKASQRVGHASLPVLSGRMSDPPEKWLKWKKKEAERHS